MSGYVQYFIYYLPKIETGMRTTQKQGDTFPPSRLTTAYEKKSIDELTIYNKSFPCII